MVLLGKGRSRRRRREGAIELNGTLVHGVGQLRLGLVLLLVLRDLSDLLKLLCLLCLLGLMVSLRQHGR